MVNYNHNRGRKTPQTRKGMEMKQIEIIKSVIKWAEEHETCMTANVCETVIICGKALLESVSMYATYQTEFMEGVIFGKTSFFNQIALVMFYSLNMYDTSCFDVDTQKLLEETKGSEELNNTKLVNARRKAGFTQKEFAALIGVAPQSLCRIERGKRRGSIEFWRKVKGALNIRAEEVFDMSEGEET